MTRPQGTQRNTIKYWGSFRYPAKFFLCSLMPPGSQGHGESCCWTCKTSYSKTEVTNYSLTYLSNTIFPDMQPNIQGVWVYDDLYHLVPWTAHNVTAFKGTARSAQWHMSVSRAPVLHGYGHGFHLGAVLKAFGTSARTVDSVLQNRTSSQQPL